MFIGYFFYCKVTKKVVAIQATTHSRALRKRHAKPVLGYAILCVGYAKPELA